MLVAGKDWAGMADAPRCDLARQLEFKCVGGSGVVLCGSVFPGCAGEKRTGID